MRAAVLFSGGKDSCLALHLAKLKGHDVKYLLSIIPKSKDSWMFHKPDLGLLEKQTEMLDIDLLVMESGGKKDEEVEDLKKLVEKVVGRVDVIVVGGIASSYQGKRIKKICGELGLEFYAPLWDFEGERVWGLLLKEGFEVIISKISCEGLPREWLGKVIGKKELQELKKESEKHGFRIDFEGGEAETAVLFMPEFKKHIKIRFDIKSEGKYRHFLDVKGVR